MLKCEFIGEAMQIKKIMFFLLLMPAILFSQDISDTKKEVSVKALREMSDKEVNDYWIQAQERGYSLDQIKILARAQGASESDLMEFENRIRKIRETSLKVEDDDLTKTQNELSSIFGLKTEDELDEEVDEPYSFINLGVFGSEFFNNPRINTSPQVNVATPESYELGPGDELAISIWGAAENEYTAKISREGYLKIERIGPVYLSGLTIMEAKSKLKDKLSKIYSGLNSNYNKVFIDVSLLASRSIIVNITGNVQAPGTYTLSSLISPLNAIYAAGGPSDNGSYRDIKILRSGKEIHSIDLYDYFVKGGLKSFSFRDQDVILIPPYKKRVFLNGEFKTNGIFEVKENEAISDLLLYNGGIASFGTKNEIYIERINGFGKSIKTVSKNAFNSFILNDGDIIEARRVGDEIKNSVSVEGAVMIPGQYELLKNPDIKSLIKSAGGLTESALKKRAYIIREVDGFPQEAKTVDLERALVLDQNYTLRNNDKLVIASIEELSGAKSVSISGEINEAGDYPFFRGMTVVDLILMSKGITEKGSYEDVAVYRSTYDKTQLNPVETITISLNEGYSNLISDQNIELLENDLVVIRSKLGYQPKEFISVSGLVKKPGNYALRTNKYSFYDLIADFEGFLPDAELNGVKLRRPVNSNEIEEIIDEAGSDSLVIDIDEYIEIGLNVKEILKSGGKISQYNLVLKGSDEIIVPRFDNSIEINGAVQQPTAISYYRGLSAKSAINKAGGFSPNAKKSAVYIVYQNGSIATTKSFLFFKNYPKLLPGGKLLVPNKADSSRKTSVAEIVGYTTSLVSIIALIKSL
tara:strand:- start:194 stop:2626 length:2433 start_codon:yes stop_codon:yes gene_type:complete